MNKNLSIMVTIFKSIKYKIISTSINNFKKIDNLNSLFEMEKKLAGYGAKKLEKKEFFPGFFITIGSKI